MAEFVLDKVENIVHLGDILLTSIFSFFHSFFQSFLSKDHENPGMFGIRLNHKTSHTILTFNNSEEEAF